MPTPPLWFRHHHRSYLHNNDNNRHKIKTTPIDDGRDQQPPNPMIMPHRHNQQQHRHMQKQQQYRLHPPSVRIQHHPKTVDHKASSTMNRLNKQHQLLATLSILRAQPRPLFMRHDNDKLQATASNNRHLDYMDMTHRNQQWPIADNDQDKLVIVVNGAGGINQQRHE